MQWRCYIVSILLYGAISTVSVTRATTRRYPWGFPSDTSSILGAALYKEQALRDSLSTLQQLPTHYFDQVSAEADKFNGQLSKHTVSALKKFRKQEEKISRKLERIDSGAARNLFGNSIDSLNHLQDLVKGKVSQTISRMPGGEYLAHLDTIQNTLGFLSKYQSELNQFNNAGAKIQSSLGSVRQLEGRLDQVQNVQQYIDERKQILTQALRQYGNVFNKSLGAISKDAYYYKAQIANYKDLWQHPDRAEAKAVGILNKIPAFQTFYKKHSELASLFNLPSDYGSASSMTGLQTRAMVERELQQRIRTADPSGQQQIQRQMQQAVQQLDQLKDKFPGLNSTAEMPDFQPKDIKSKTLFQRLSYGANVSFEKATNYFPTTSDLAAQIAYKFSDKGSVGIGSAFKLGWGSDVRKIHFTAQGIGFRSFLDYKLKGTFYLNGGFELQYDKTVPNISVLEGLNGWTRSALLGIERKYKISRKLTGNVMVLFDFMYRQNDTQPVVFRTGYSF